MVSAVAQSICESFSMQLMMAAIMSVAMLMDVVALMLLLLLVMEIHGLRLLDAPSPS